MPSIDFAAVPILALSVASSVGRLCSSRHAPRNDGSYSTAGATTNDSLQNITGEVAPARYVPSAAIFAGNQGPHRPHDVSPIAASTSGPICFLAMLTSSELSMSDL